MLSASVKQCAEALRSQGYSYNYIARQVCVSKSTLSSWLADVSYSPNTQTLRLLGKARAAAGRRMAEKKQESLKRARSEALQEMGPMNHRDLFMFGLGLYLGEGNKTHDIVRIVNSDPNVIQASIAWFKVLGVPHKNLRLSLHLYPDSNIQQSLQFWSKKTNIPLARFRKTQIDHRQGKKAQRAGKLPHGTAHLHVVSGGNPKLGVHLARKVTAWMNGALTEAGLV